MATIDQVDRTPFSFLCVCLFSASLSSFFCFFFAWFILCWVFYRLFNVSFFAWQITLHMQAMSQACIGFLQANNFAHATYFTCNTWAQWCKKELWRWFILTHCVRSVRCVVVRCVQQRSYKNHLDSYNLDSRFSSSSVIHTSCNVT